MSLYLRSRAGASAHPATVCRALHRLAPPRKKSLEAAERDEGQRQQFRQEAEAIARRRLVFADETGFNLSMTRRFGRAPRGRRVRQSVPRRRGTHVTLVGALALHGWVAALSFSGSLDREAFDAFITELLVPRLRRSDVVLLDNLRVHHASDVEEAVRSTHARVLWLPTLFAGLLAAGELLVKGQGDGQRERATHCIELRRCADASSELRHSRRC